MKDCYKTILFCLLHARFLTFFIISLKIAQAVFSSSSSY